MKSGLVGPEPLECLLGERAAVVGDGLIGVELLDDEAERRHTCTNACWRRSRADERSGSRRVSAEADDSDGKTEEEDEEG